jgi:hypothetical protein
MFKKTITFKDFNDQEQTKDFYFHMSKAELLAMAADGNAMMARIERIIQAQDGRAILQEYRQVLSDAVGVRSEDGSRFIKDDDAKSQFLDSPAFDELLMELCTDADASVEFIRQLIPESMQKEMQKQLAKQKDQDPFKEPEDVRPAWLKEGRTPTDEELRDMSQDELRMAFRERHKRQ